MRVSNIYQCLNIISTQQGQVQLFHLMLKIIYVGWMHVLCFICGKNYTKFYVKEPHALQIVSI